MEEFLQEILQIIKSNLSSDEIREQLSHYHDSDIAEVIPLLNEEERKKLYLDLDPQQLSDVLTYVEDVDQILENIPDEKAADIIERMDADDAVDVLQELDEDDRSNIIELMEKDAAEDAQLILSYEEDQVGAKMTTNFITISMHDDVKQAMKKVVSEANENDNIMTLFVLDDEGKIYGTLALKDLICARQGDDWLKLVITSYPSVHDSQKIDDVINDLKDYGDMLVPVLNSSEHLIGVITSSDMVEAVDDALGEDYSKLAGLTSEEDLNESIWKSMAKRIPWLLLLLLLGFVVSFLISRFEMVIAAIPIIVFFQSSVLDMAGNSGTQSLAVTIRVLSDDEVKGKKLRKLIRKELTVGALNGLVLSLVSFAFVFIYMIVTKSVVGADAFSYLDSTKVALCVGIALFVAMFFSTGVGTAIPIIFKKIHVDPAVASGPLITTLNDIIAVACYYGIALLLFSTYIF